jgi:phage terminase large subunit GpA-like protein
MRSLKVAGIMLVVVALASIAMAGPNSMGIKDVSKVTFVAPIRVGTTLLPAGDYVVRHTMEGEEHIMVFQSENSKTPEVKVKCTLVRLAQKADHNQTVYSLDANNVRTLQELVFRGDTAKHVF